MEGLGTAWTFGSPMPDDLNVLLDPTHVSQMQELWDNIRTVQANDAKDREAFEKKQRSGSKDKSSSS